MQYLLSFLYFIQLFISSFFTYGVYVFILTLIIGIILINVLNKYIDKTLNKIREKKANESERDALSAETTYKFLSKILKTGIKVIVLIMIILQFRPLSSITTTLLGATGIIAVMVGLACQESAATLIGGLFLTLFKPFVQGDLIYLPEKNLTGRVIDVSLRHTTIMTVNNSKVIVPNNVMNSAIIENREEDGKYYNFINYGVAYGSDYKLVKELIMNEALSNELAIKDNIDVSITELSDSAVNFRLGVYTKDLPTGKQLEFELNEKLLEIFKQNNIEIPYNTQTIFLKKD